MEKISIVVPAYNEEKRIGETLEKYCDFLRNKNDFEIVVVLNACKDDTLKIVMEKKKKFKEIRYFRYS